MNAQYEIEFEEPKIESYYIDQAMRGGSLVFSAYTPYGIRQIDSQYCTLIRNINCKVAQLYAIKRRRYEYLCNIKTREVSMSPTLGTFYDPINFDGEYYEVRVLWENGHQHDFYYGNKVVFDPITRKTNPEQLKVCIKNNPHLHVKIKENLLENLENYLKLDYKY